MRNLQKPLKDQEGGLNPYHNPLKRRKWTKGKTMLTLLIAVIAVVNINLIQAQKVIISGTITDSKSGETMISANVYDGNTLKGTVSNNYGFYSLQAQKGKVLLRCSYIGYNDFEVELDVQQDMNFNISLVQNLSIEEVVVRNNSPRKTVESTQMSKIELKLADIKTAPVLFGEVDVLKTLQTLPGVQGGTEGTSGFFVRGGAPDQNLILLDGVPVYNASHLFGLFSVFNADAIKNVSLIKGGFPARYGGRISSVVDIRMKEGDMKKFHGEGSVGLLSSKLTLEGPIIKDKTSFLISGRRTYYDILSMPIQAMINRKEDSYNTWVTAYFYDLNAKVNHKFSDKDRLYLSAYMGRDRFGLTDKGSETYGSSSDSYEETGGIGWGNITSSLRWNHQFSSRLFSNLTAVFSDYTFKTFVQGNTESIDENGTEREEYDLTYYSRIRSYGLKYEFDFPVNNNHYIRYGISNTTYQFSPGVGSYKENYTGSDYNYDTTIGKKNIPGNESYVYLEDEISISSNLKANVGAHLSMFNTQGKNYYSLEPRLSARYLVTDDLSLKASYVRMNQYINLLTNSTVGLPTDLWVPSTKRILPQRSWQTAMGVAYNLNDSYEFTLEGYYKEMKNLTEFGEGFGFFSLGTNELDELTTQGIGTSYGVEFMAQKTLGKFRGWVSYTLSWSNRTFAEISNGRTFPFKYDRRHNLALIANYDFSDRFNMALGWTYYTGSSFSLEDELSVSPDDLSPYDKDPYFPQSEIYTDGYLETRNNYRFPGYHRLDLGFNFTKQKKRIKRTWSFGAYNAYSRKNPFMLYKSTSYSGTGETNSEIKQVSILPILPYVRYSFKF